MFRSIVWGVTRRFGRATLIASTVGQVFGILMIGLGVVRIAFGDVFGGVWTIFIAWFLIQAAGASREEGELFHRGAPKPTGPIIVESTG